MSVSLATVTPNVLAPDRAGVHTVRQARGKLVCIARGCTFAASDWSAALHHISDRQWTAWRDMPKDLQLTAEQEAA